MSTTYTGTGTVLTQQATAADLIYLVVRMSKFGNRKKMDPTSVAVRAEGADDVVTAEVDGAPMVHMSKALLDSPELRAVVNLDSEVKSTIRGGQRTVNGRTYRTPGVALPSMVREGIYAVQPGRVREVNDMLEEYREERGRRVESFLAALPRLRDEARVRLGANFCEEDYPNADALNSRFGVSWRWVQIGAPENLRTIDQQMFAEASEQARIEIERLVDATRALLIEETQGLCAHLADRLSGNDDGKRKTFRDSMIPGVLDALRLIRSRDLGTDPRVAEALARAEQLVQGVDAAALRSSDSLREATATGFARLRDDLDGLLIDAPGRKVQVE